jgi:ankyrin repeat protein
LGRPGFYAQLELEIAKLLLDAGAALDAKDSYGNTPLRRATLQRDVFATALGQAAQRPNETLSL